MAEVVATALAPGAAPALAGAVGAAATEGAGVTAALGATESVAEIAGATTETAVETALTAEETAAAAQGADLLSPQVDTLAAATPDNLPALDTVLNLPDTATNPNNAAPDTAQAQNQPASPDNQNAAQNAPPTPDQDQAAKDAAAAAEAKAEEDRIMNLSEAEINKMKPLEKRDVLAKRARIKQEHLGEWQHQLDRLRFRQRALEAKQKKNNPPLTDDEKKELKGIPEQMKKLQDQMQDKKNQPTKEEVKAEDDLDTQEQTARLQALVEERNDIMGKIQTLENKFLTDGKLSDAEMAALKELVRIRNEKTNQIEQVKAHLQAKSKRLSPAQWAGIAAAMGLFSVLKAGFDQAGEGGGRRAA